jgi:hypothetical protein
MKRLAALPFLFLLTVDLGAQSRDTSGVPGDSVVQRASQLVKNGREAEARRIIDSVLKVATPDHAVYAEALYWRGVNAPTAAEAEREYRRLLIESPLSSRAEDALLQLAQLTQARGDRRAASDYLQRFMLTYAHSPARPRVALSLVRLLFDMGPQQQARACEAYRMGRDAIPQENLELRNQLDYYGPRCSLVMAETTAIPAPVDSAPAPTTVPSPDTTPRPSPPSPSPAPASAGSRASFYSVQVAAYETRESADRLVSLLVERGLAARVDGASRPFRVRIGRYTTRADAVKAATLLKSQGHPGFVTLVNNR